MSKGTRKRYTKEFKLSVVKAMLGGTQRPKEIFAEYEVKWTAKRRTAGSANIKPGARARLKTRACCRATSWRGFGRKTNGFGRRMKC